MFDSGETITVTRLGAENGTLDEAGNPGRATSTTLTFDNVAIAPMTPQESAELFGNVDESGFTLYLGPDDVLLSTDVVSIRGVAGYQVFGGAAAVNWRSPFSGWNPGRVAIVKKAS